MQSFQLAGFFMFRTECRASITNMMAVKKFTARGRVDEACVALQQEGAAMWQEVGITWPCLKVILHGRSQEQL